MSKNIKILFVCLGNICRSPLAEGIMKKLSDIHQLHLFVDSAGTANYHVGESPDTRSVAIAKKNKIDISQQRSRQFTIKDFDHFNFIFAMDNSNYQNICSLNANMRPQQLFHLRKFDLHSNSLDIPDPYYGKMKDFINCFNMIYRSCEAFLVSKKFI